MANLKYIFLNQTSVITRQRSCAVVAVLGNDREALKRMFSIFVNWTSVQDFMPSILIITLIRICNIATTDIRKLEFLYENRRMQ